jgi:hypothetical protein
MGRLSKLLLGLALGLAVGSIVSTKVAWWLLHRIYEWIHPPALESWMIAFPTLPLVPFAGAVAGAAVGLCTWKHGGRVGLAAAFVCGGCASLIALMALGWGISQSTNVVTISLALLVPSFSVPLFVCALLTAISAVTYTARLPKPALEPAAGEAGA